MVCVAGTILDKNGHGEHRGRPLVALKVDDGGDGGFGGALLSCRLRVPAASEAACYWPEHVIMAVRIRS